MGERRAWRACLVEGRPVCPGHRGRGRLEVGAWNGEAVPAGAVFTGKKLRPGEDGWDGAAAETACGSGNGDVPGRFFLSTGRPLSVRRKCAEARRGTKNAVGEMGEGNGSLRRKRENGDARSER